ncbi:hypothetical protein Bca4012_080126 [Brassica carinata]
MRCQDDCSFEPKEIALSASNSENQGVCFQTCLAKSQWKNRWSVVSWDPHLTQMVFDNTSLLWRLSSSYGMLGVLGARRSHLLPS